MTTWNIWWQLEGPNACNAGMPLPWRKPVSQHIITNFNNRRVRKTSWQLAAPDNFIVWNFLFSGYDHLSLSGTTKIIQNYFTSCDPPPWHLYILLLANLLAFYLTYLLAFYLAYLLAFYLAYLLAYYLLKSSGILSGKHSGTLSGISSGILSDI